MTRPVPGLLGVRAREAPVSGLLFACFFLAVAIFQVLKPLKNGLFVETFGAERELLAKLANIVSAGVAVAAFGVLRRRLGRHVLHALCGVFAAAFVGLSYLLLHPGPVEIWLFYLLGDLVAVTLLTALWAFTTEIVTPDQARRLFGPIGSGAVLGGLAGVTAARLLLPVLGMTGLLLLSAVAVLLMAALFSAAERLAARAGAFGVPPSGPDLAVGGGEGGRADLDAALQGARQVARSRFLLAIVIVMAAYEGASQVMDFQFKSLTESLPSVETTQTYLSNVYLLANLLSVGTQVLLVGLLMRRAGLVATLLVLPTAILGTSLVFATTPVLWAGSLLVIADNGLNYSVQQTGRETLFTVASRDEKYNARAFINVFVQRVAKGLAVLLVLGLGAAGLSLGDLGLVTAGFAAVMVAAGVVAGRHFERSAGKEGG